MKSYSIFLLVPLALVLLYFIGYDTANETHLDSDNCKNKQERIEQLATKIKAFSEFSDAEFELFNVNGFVKNTRSGDIPGASSWDYKFVVKVEPSDVPKWTTGLTVGAISKDNSWMGDIIAQRKENWKTTSTPTFYHRSGSNVSVIIFKGEGFIFKRIMQL